MISSNTRITWKLRDRPTRNPCSKTPKIKFLCLQCWQMKSHSIRPRASTTTSRSKRPSPNCLSSTSRPATTKCRYQTAKTQMCYICHPRLLQLRLSWFSHSCWVQLSQHRLKSSWWFSRSTTWIPKKHTSCLFSRSISKRFSNSLPPPPQSSKCHMIPTSRTLRRNVLKWSSSVMSWLADSRTPWLKWKQKNAKPNN